MSNAKTGIPIAIYLKDFETYSGTSMRDLAHARKLFFDLLANRNAAIDARHPNG
jgi:UDP-glucose 4-epimerase